MNTEKKIQVLRDHQEEIKALRRSADSLNGEAGRLQKARHEQRPILRNRDGKVDSSAWCSDDLRYAPQARALIEEYLSEHLTAIYRLAELKLELEARRKKDRADHLERTLIAALEFDQSGEGGEP